MYQSMVLHEFKKKDGIYTRDDGKYIIKPIYVGSDKMFRVFDVEKGIDVFDFWKLKHAKMIFGVERKG